MAPHLQRFSFSFCDCPLWLAMSRLQSGSGRSGMGFNGHFAQRQFLETDVRDGSEADILGGLRDVRLPPKADIVQHGGNVRFVQKADSCSAAGWRSHSIRSSASDKNDAGIVSPSAFAVVRLRTNSNLVGCLTGRSPGFAPCRILSTMSAARQWRAADVRYGSKADIGLPPVGVRP